MAMSLTAPTAACSYPYSSTCTAADYLFPIEAPGVDPSLLTLVATKDTQTMLLQTRTHLASAEEKLRKELANTEEQMVALQSLCAVCVCMYIGTCT